MLRALKEACLTRCCCCCKCAVLENEPNERPVRTFSAISAQPSDVGEFNNHAYDTEIRTNAREPEQQQQQELNIQQAQGTDVEQNEVYHEDQGQRWHVFELSRQECEHLLMRPPARRGTFMIRKCLSRPGQFSLSVLNGPNSVHHFIIFEENRRFRIDTDANFASLRDLVHHYMGNSFGTMQRLTVPCGEIPQREHTIPRSLDGRLLSRASLREGHVIGEGQFGWVKRGKLLDTFDVAIKQAKPDPKSLKEFEEEAVMMAKLAHRHIVKLYGVVHDDAGDFLIVTELMPHGDLLKYMRAKGEDFQLTDQITVMMQVVDGMTYLEQNNVTHRDLRAANVLVGENSLYKIADLGLARLIDEEDFNIDTALPVRWTAPEVLQYRVYTHKSDVWSFGVLLFEIATRGEMPYADMSNKEVMRHVIDGNFLHQPDGCDDMMYVVMTNCWSLSVDQRATFASLKELLTTYYGEADEPAFANET